MKTAPEIEFFRLCAQFRHARYVGIELIKDNLSASILQDTVGFEFQKPMYNRAQMARRLGFNKFNLRHRFVYAISFGVIHRYLTPLAIHPLIWQPSNGVFTDEAHIVYTFNLVHERSSETRLIRTSCA